MKAGKLTNICFWETGNDGIWAFFVQNFLKRLLKNELNISILYANCYSMPTFRKSPSIVNVSFREVVDLHFKTVYSWAKFPA